MSSFSLQAQNKIEKTCKNGIGILEFLPGKNYLVTGATGFLGKAIIEKLLRAAPNVSQIYLLIKAENEEAALERIKTEIIDSNLFDLVRYMHGKSYQDFMLSKVVPIPGNIGESNLGMNPDLMMEIAKEVDVIINSAANTTFDERFDVAVSINTRGPSRVLDFAKKCKKLCCFIHIYQLIDKNREEIPVAIVRPSVIESTFKEPYPGWLQGIRMADPFILADGKGYLPAFINPEAVIDIIPVDMVVNAIISAMAKHGITWKQELNVYHITSSRVNPVKLKFIFDMCFEHFKFESSDTYKLWEAMSLEEQLSFGFDVQCLDWKDYFYNIHMPGLRKYVMKSKLRPKL
ncbi:fatty acyl-CoA reductase 2, chloroplastic-like [Mangifera indica]|uniref:fatty acyl-CoA reductase 2, chloroplastic-like n=1 Tax=Mangifera indica TaxID=29780 RepID=UPI001CFB3AE1|nr:fatty acyl-CoA reductase 2, chloroplastic-like [Mangifera indica]